LNGAARKTMTDKDVPLEITVRDLDAWRKSGLRMQLLDVREPWEVALGVIEGAIHIPLGQVPGRAGELAKDELLVVYCRSGRRSMDATNWLRARGYAQATNVAGGILAWSREIDSSLPLY
jgi:rhodanese-related sulfurtransferase